MNNNIIDLPPSSTILAIALFFPLLLLNQCVGVNENLAHHSDSEIHLQTAHSINLNDADIKQKGAHVFGRIDSTDFQPLTKNNLEWVTLVAWADQDDFDSPIVKHFNGDSMRLQRSDSGWLKRIEILRAGGFKVFVKPHIWIHAPSNGTWRADIFPANEEHWELWKESYRDFIFRYAKIAELANAEMFCIGTELSRLSAEKPIFWKNLIRDVRSKYSGKITYAANWHNEYEVITFWDELDYIGIQAYFPLVKNEYPSVEQICIGWNKYIPAMESMSNKYNRKILFTELGYKSTADGAIKPWEWLDYPLNQDKILSTETQSNCYEAFFESVWTRSWFAGVHIWFMRNDYIERVGRDHLDFSPQGKQAEKIISTGFEG